MCSSILKPIYSFPGYLGDAILDHLFEKWDHFLENALNRTLFPAGFLSNDNLDSIYEVFSERLSIYRASIASLVVESLSYIATPSALVKDIRPTSQ